MADTALFVGWGARRGGRERGAAGVFGEALQFFAACQQEGRIEGFEPFLLEWHGGDLAGFLLLRGAIEQLTVLRYSDDFQRLLERADIVVGNLGVVTAYTGARLQQMMQNEGPNVADLM